MPIRFAARVFSCELERCQGVLHSAHGELEDLRFVTVHTALATLPMIDTTQFMLGEMQRVVVAGERNAIKHTPYMFYRENMPCVIYE